MINKKILFGKLQLSDIPYDNPIIVKAAIFIFFLILSFISITTYFKKWKYIWQEWIKTVDHKKIGTMYFILSVLMMFRGLMDAIMMRIQQCFSYGKNYGFLSAHHFSEIFTAHGTIMIFFVAMGFLFAFANWIIPLQIGARDVAFPYLNALSFWLFCASIILINASLLIGKFSGAGWLAYPPLSEIHYSPDVGVDYYIWALQISGLGTLLSSINFITTILLLRCKGMSLMKMPIFVWTILCSMILVIIAFPILTVTLGLLFLDRFLNMHFFTSSFGGNMMLYINLIWAWGHPEVYILILPAFGIYSEITSVFSRKKLFGYTSMIWATASITILSFIVWLHHFFTMGGGSNVNTFFSITTMIISIPTGVKIFNWLFTMYRGKIKFTQPMMWTIAFITTFVIGGMTGVLLALPAVDFLLHNSLFLIAHFHNMIIGGVLFGFFAGINYWFPKVFGISIENIFGKIAFYLWIIGFYIAFMPLYFLGFMGMPRRLYHIPNIMYGWHILLKFAFIGTIIILLAVILQFIQVTLPIINFIRNKKHIKGDSWGLGRTLEWSTSSPPPFYNFAIQPRVHNIDQYYEDKYYNYHNNNYHDIHMPKDSSLPFFIGIFSTMIGFSFVWKIYWMLLFGIFGIMFCIIKRFFTKQKDYFVNKKTIEKYEKNNV